MKVINYLIIYILIINISIIHIVSGNSGDIIINNDEKLLESEKPWELFEGYNLTVTIIDRDRVLVSLSKSGIQIPIKGVYKESPYRYIDNKTGNQILYFYLQDINDNKIRLKHVYQYSNGEFSPTPTVTSISSLTLVALEKTLIKNETWNIGDGWKLKAQTIDSKTKKVNLEIYNNEIKLNEAILSQGDIYNYNNIFTTKITHVFFQSNTDFVRLSDTYINSKSIPIPTPTSSPTATKISNDPFFINEIHMALKSQIRDIGNYIIYIIIIIFVVIAIRYSQKKNGHSSDTITSNGLTDEYGEIKDSEFIYDESMTDEYGEIK